MSYKIYLSSEDRIEKISIERLDHNLDHLSFGYCTQRFHTLNGQYTFYGQLCEKNSLWIDRIKKT